MLLPVAALDDVICTIVFGIASSISTSMILEGDPSVVSRFLVPFGKILLALLLALGGGLLFARVQRYAQEEEDLLSMLLGFIFLIS